MYLPGEKNYIARPSWQGPQFDNYWGTAKLLIVLSTNLAFIEEHMV